VGLTEKALDRFVTRARRTAGLRASVNVLVTSNAEIEQELNRRFRNKNQPTDVLSFPALPGFEAAGLRRRHCNLARKSLLTTRAPSDTLPPTKSRS